MVITYFTQDIDTRDTGGYNLLYTRHKHQGYRGFISYFTQYIHTRDTGVLYPHLHNTYIPWIQGVITYFTQYIHTRDTGGYNFLYTIHKHQGYRGL